MKPKILPLLPLGNGVLLPHMTVPLALETPEARAAVAAAKSASDRLIAVSRLDGQYIAVGCEAEIMSVGRTPSGTEAIIIKGVQRAVLGMGVPATGDALWVQYESRPDPPEVSERAQELASEFRSIIENIAEVRGATQIVEFLRDITEPGALADVAAYAPDLSTAQRIELLETFDVEKRLEKVTSWGKAALAELNVKKKIRENVTEDVNKTQREYLLRRQLEAIKKELGESSEDGEQSLVETYRKRIDEAGMPEIVRTEAERELKRLERTNEQAAEHGWIRNYLDWLCDVPWSKRTDDQLEIQEARRILDEEHSGLADVKDRILEFLAVRKLRSERGRSHTAGKALGTILTLVGPPGVGKTSLGESIAHALGRKFVRVSLGGVRDEAEIRGHRRTYIGSMPGRIVRALKEAGSKNPVLMLDEVDKVGNDWRGDPASALLEVLDPAQNHSFKDHYLEVGVDLSEVLFVCTANLVDTIPAALLDRMEVIRLDGYTELEKVAIARQHLIARQVDQNGLNPDEVTLTEPAIQKLIANYTREAGVRSLERQLGSLLRKVATKIAKAELVAPVSIGVDELTRYLGRRKFFFEAADRTTVPGVATGLSVTGTGGDVLFIEATRLEADQAGELTLTGQLGDVMKESARIALSYVSSQPESLGIARAAVQQPGKFHVHVPAGAIPKDGPSAGVTMTTALTSLLTGRPVRPSVGMTGEITLRGRVLPVGGIKQKVLAAHRSGLKEVILPRRNEGDLDDVPESVREQMVFHLVDEVSEAVHIALTPEHHAQASVAA